MKKKFVSLRWKLFSTYLILGISIPLIIYLVLNYKFPEVINAIKAEDSFVFVFIFFAIALISTVIGLLFSSYFYKPINHLTGAIRDINFGKKYETFETDSVDELSELVEQFNIMMAKIEQVNDVRDKFVSNVSHELRTPIASILIISDTLVNDPSRDIEVYKDFMVDINFELHRLSKITNTLLGLIKIEKNELKLEYDITNLNNVAIKVINTLKPLADQKNIEIIFNSSEILIARVDTVKVSQAILNILNNAIKYTLDNGKIYVDAFTTKDNVRIAIKDTGIGIPAEDLNNIFDRFYRVDEARARDTGGVGLGLSIAKQIMMLHMGSIEIESEPNVGSTFTLVFPKSVIVKNK